MNSKRELGVYSILLLKQMNYLHIFFIFEIINQSLHALLADGTLRQSKR